MTVSTPVRIVNQNGYSAAMTENGELWTTQTVQEADVWSQYQNLFSATEYVILVSKDNPLFPHKRQGQNGSRLDGSKLIYVIDTAANTSAVMRIGVVTRIDGTNADIKYFANLPFLTGASKTIIIVQLEATPSQVKLDFNKAGTLLHGITNTVENDVAAVNTATTLDSPAGAILPGLGDIIMKYEHSSG